ncbi:tail fiber domain-containing protein [Citrobacter sp. Ct235]|uniref:tail fiber domain-containing protein n=1 Tax=Citrobacter sp. Ct235 TaxID=2985157 RepID=UPI002574D615|nr:tail fiber domain-containing protein [Citrobacter sp. Ct235]MDM2738387.1 tail fiber domain-containing protein [Citrobacter sp. Ct235]
MPGLFNDRVNDDATNIISSSESADRAEAAAKRSEKAADDSIYAASEAQDAAALAQQSEAHVVLLEGQAAQEAADAAVSAQTAINYANDANDYMVAASAAADRAEAADHDMQVQIDEAHGYAAAAAISASDAKTFRDAAGTYATNSANSSTLAQQWAISPTLVASQDQSSKTYAGQSKTSATNAATSASNAQKSESNASIYAANASTSATKAGQSEANAALNATNAKTSETNSKTNSDAAAQSQFLAKQSETNSKASELKAKDWAEKMDGAVETGLYSSHHWAKVAQDAAVQKDVLLKSENLADLPDVTIAKTNLGIENVINAPALSIDNNLSDVADINVARTNIGAAESGINSSITNLTGLSGGALRLGSDGVGDFDAVTMRQWKAGGGGGSNMTGVANFAIGSLQQYLSRAYLPSDQVFADGQLLKRDEWPDLWTYAQATTPIADSEWIASTNKRAMYSTGDGSTTFRVPDMNGVQKNGVDGFTGPSSIVGLFFRGDGGGYYVPGYTFLNGAPNITGKSGAVDANGRAVFSSGVGSLFINSSEIMNGFVTSSATSTANRYSYINFDASRSHPAYGRSADEVRPNNAAGVWAIRASGNFTAAKTEFSVINTDDVVPPVGTSTYGGSLKSVYNIGTEKYAEASFSARNFTSTSNVQYAHARVAASNKEGESSEWLFGNDGVLTLPSTDGYKIRTNDSLLTTDSNFYSKSLSAQNGGIVQSMGPEQNAALIQAMPSGQSSGSYVNVVQGNWYGGAWILGGVRSANQSLARAQLNVRSTTGATMGSFLFNPDSTASCKTWINSSDIRIKDNIEPIQNALTLMKAFDGVTWDYKVDGSKGYGFVAQDVQTIFPEAVSESNYNQDLPDGTTVENVLNVNTIGVSAALHHQAIKELMAVVEDLQQQINELKK